MENPLTNISNISPDSIYILVQWPDVQDLMEYDWFRPECYLHNAMENQEYLDSAYFVPLARLREINQINN